MKNLTAVFEEAKEGGYVGWIEEMPEVMSQGETLEETRDNLRDALKEMLAYKRQQSASCK